MTQTAFHFIGGLSEIVIKMFHVSVEETRKMHT